MYQKFKMKDVLGLLDIIFKAKMEQGLTVSDLLDFGEKKDAKGPLSKGIYYIKITQKVRSKIVIGIV